MERKIMSDLIKWKKDSSRKPLLLYGNKQVGKTYTALEFGKKEYKTVAYLDCYNNYDLLDILEREKTLDKIVLKLSLLVGESILKNDTLIIFDNVDDMEIIKTIKRVSKEASEYHIMLITSLKTNVLKFKGEELQLKYMPGVDFEEYLKALGQEQLIDFIKESYKKNISMPFHSLAMDYYEKYIMVGSFPEAIEVSLKEDNELLLNSIHKKIVGVYLNDFSKFNNLMDIVRSQEVFEISPYQLLKTNKKFQYGLMKLGGRSKEYENAIEFLSQNNILNASYKIGEVTSPLSKAKDKDSFKLYLSDTGLLFYMLHLNKIRFLSEDKLKYILYENSIANSIVNCGYNLYYYQSDGKAEVNFVVQTRTGKILPIELVNKNISKSKSLTLLMNKFDIKEAIRITDENFSQKKGVRYIPIYATFCFKENL